MFLFGGDLFASVFLKQNALACYQIQQLAVFRPVPDARVRRIPEESPLRRADESRVGCPIFSAYADDDTTLKFDLAQREGFEYSNATVCTNYMV